MFPRGCCRHPRCRVPARCLPASPQPRGSCGKALGVWGKNLGWLLTAPTRSSPTSMVGKKIKIKPESGLVTFPHTRPRLGELGTPCHAWQAVLALAVLEAALPPRHGCGSSSRAQVSSPLPSPFHLPACCGCLQLRSLSPTRLAPGCFSPPSVAAVLPGLGAASTPVSCFLGLLPPSPAARRFGRPTGVWPGDPRVPKGFVSPWRWGGSGQAPGPTQGMGRGSEVRCPLPNPTHSLPGGFHLFS